MQSADRGGWKFVVVAAWAELRPCVWKERAEGGQRMVKLASCRRARLGHRHAYAASKDDEGGGGPAPETVREERERVRWRASWAQREGPRYLLLLHDHGRPGRNCDKLRPGGRCAWPNHACARRLGSSPPPSSRNSEQSGVVPLVRVAG